MTSTTTTSQATQQKQWYVMAAYKFELKAAASLRENGLETFLPVETIYVKRPHRRPTPVERPAISTLIFVHATFDDIRDYKQRIDDRLKFRMDAYATDSAGQPQPMTVPDDQMATFITIWTERATYNPTIQPAQPLPAGSTVEIISGPLSGHRATLLSPLTPRSRTARLSLPLSSLLSVTLSLPLANLRENN